MEETTTPPIQNNNTVQEKVPNSVAVLVLGILSIVFCWCYGFIGLTLGIIALILASKGKKLHAENPDKYTTGSFSNLKAGRVCAIIGTIISALYMIYVIAILAIYGAALSQMPWDQF